jgi:hypothetical protein
MKENKNDTRLPSIKGGAGGGSDDIASVILNGITFKGSGSKDGRKKEPAGVKTKARKKQYITGAHGSGAAKKKADIRMRRANRHK